MLAATLLAALAAPIGVPSPLDLAVADAALHAPPDADVPPRSARMRVAVLAVMSRLGAMDAGVEGQWLTANLDWASEWGYARKLVAEVAACPTLAEDTLPPGEWYAAEAKALAWQAERHRAAARECRDRIPWEDDREAALTAWAIYHEAAADGLACRAERAGLMAGGSWQRPRRVVLRMGRE